MRSVGRTAAWRRRPPADQHTEPLGQTAAPRGRAHVRWEATSPNHFLPSHGVDRERGSTRERWAPAEALQQGPPLVAHFAAERTRTVRVGFSQRIHFDTHAPPTIHPRFGMAPMVRWTAAATRLGLVMPMLLEPAPMCVDDQLPTCQGAIVCQPEP